MLARTAAAVIAAAVAVPAAVGASGYTYTGALRTDTTKKVTMKTAAGYVTKFTALVPATCDRSRLDLVVAFPPSGKKGARAKIAKGRFSATFSGTGQPGTTDRRTIAGTVKGRAIIGTIRIRGLCNADATYSVRR